MGKKNCVIPVGSFLLFIFLVSFPEKVQAAIELKSDKEGNITWVTEPKMASSGIKWRTQGFLIYAGETSYGHPLKSGEPYGKILVDDKRVIVKTDWDNDEKKYITTFTISADYTKSVISSNSKLYQQFKQNLLSNQPYIYFNNFFESYRVNGDGSETILTSNMYDIDAIRNNQAWANKEEWNTGYYNVRVPYKVTGNVHVKLSDSSGNYLGTSTGVFNDAGVEIRDVVADGAVKKNPSLAFYSEKYAGQGLCDSSRTVYVGDTVEVSLPLQVSADGKIYELYRSYYYQTTDDTVKQSDTQIKNDREGTVTKQIELGLQSSMVVGRYKETGTEIEEPEEGDVMEGEFTEAEASGVIASGEPGHSEFDVRRGIPVTEGLYTQVFAPKYLAGYRFTNKCGVKTYMATGTITWNLSWIEGEGEEAALKTAVQTVAYTVPVERTYSYWEISGLDVYGLANATVNNGTFPAGSVTLTPKDYEAPQVSYIHMENVDDHVFQPEEIGQTLNLGTMSYNAPAPPVFNASALLNARVGECKVKNDRLVFDGKLVMNDAESRKTALSPETIETEPEEVSEKTLYASGLVIPVNRANGNYESSGTVAYGRIAGVNSERPAVMMVNVEEINPVMVHTPVVCMPTAEDKRNLCQLIQPEISRTELVLDATFRLSLPTVGEHRDIPGYGVRDYGKYTAARQVKFPFDVYKGARSESFVPAETWTELGTDVLFYLPPWVKEGLYTISFRSIALNAAANNGISLTETGVNYDSANYTAVNTVRVEVSGKIYGFRIHDISDDDDWGDVFWDENGAPTGFHYRVGTRNEFGYNTSQEKKFTLPVVDGSHPYFLNLGALKTGYTFRYQVDTIGDYEDRSDFIQITPTFFYVNGKNGKRQEVDLYYSETFEATGKRELLVKVGSSRDMMNQHRVKNVDCFTFGEVRIPEKLMSCRKPEIPVNLSMAGKTESDVSAHLQTWNGEYYLPQEIHVCPKNFDLKGWTRKHGALDYTENFWLKNGYVIVNFNIETIQDGERHLSYINQENAGRGYCNMWKMEGGVSRKSDINGVSYKISDGDVIFYYTDKSIRDDYQSSVVY